MLHMHDIVHWTALSDERNQLKLVLVIGTMNCFCYTTQNFCESSKDQQCNAVSMQTCIACIHIYPQWYDVPAKAIA